MGKKTKTNAAVAPIFRNRADKGLTRAADQHESETDSEASDTDKNPYNLNPVARGHLKGLLHDIKSNMAAELAKHMARIRESLEDLTRRTLAVEYKMDDISTTTAIQELCGQGNVQQRITRSTSG
ncbi:Hypothetical predicted protein [Pelobates cultripes]|uniref:Uncharacterized protein n=1 Tax=Pelobates cultripes TaxID=61616 RepID=A0AAD1SB33_PELCU|nr:Hypothetical predicted protein [Pelobates cultripes]